MLTVLMLGCGGDDAEGVLDAGSTQATGQPSGASSGTSGAASSADASAGASNGASTTSPGGSSDAGSAMGNPGSNSGASTDAGTPASTRPDASVNLTDAGKADAGSADAGSTVDPSGLPKFSFFVTSHAAIIALAGDAKGFGGDLRHGETGSGAGLRGADKICTEIAERGMAGAGAKQWRAFLSAAAGGASGGAVNARDRIGSGPWYDRSGRLVGNSVTDLLAGDRPSNADPQIRDDLPNETGTPNHAPSGSQIDNHDTLTGSDTGGRYVSGSETCQDWTSSASSATGGGGGPGGGSGPSIGHSWPRSPSNGRHWVSDHRAGGCAKGVNLAGGSTDGTATVGSGGGYGGFYCFALTP